ncbi:MAG: hypothetical protein KDK36_18120 [Leptospiraceae bacterium]|nr:hypothetical protein [Leptospiraceae bacterium]
MEINFKKFFLIIILPFFINCFEYEETIHFKKGFAGYVNIEYAVPIHPKTGKTLVRFLPITSEEIENRINKGFFNKNLRIRNFKFQVLDPEPLSTWGPNIKPLFTKKAKVSYRLDFTDLGNLDGVLLGYLFVKKRGNSITVRREFKSVLKGIDPDSSPGEKKIRSETVRLLGDGYVLFKVEFPISSDCKSNKGEIGLGSLIYKLPLVDTIEKPGIKSWDYSIYNN